MKKESMGIGILEITIGLALFVCSLLGLIDNFWSGFGGGIIGVGVLQTVRQLRYRRDPDYQEKMNIEAKDERNQYMIQRASRGAVVLYVVAGSVGVVLLQIAGKTELAQAAAISVAALALFFFGCYWYLKKKL